MHLADLTNVALPLFALASCMALSAACGGDSAAQAGSGASSAESSASSSRASSASSSSGAGAGGGDVTCDRTPPPADRDRVVIVSHPFSASGGKSPAFEVLKLDTSGALSKTGETYDLASTPEGKVVFTPDGRVAISTDENGDLGVVRFDDSGAPTVVHAHFHGQFYATSVVVEAGGATALVLDADTTANGGGLYRVGIACDGTLTDMGLVAAANLPYGLAPIANGARAVLAAGDVLGSNVADSVALLSTSSPTPSLLGAVDAFGDGAAGMSLVSTVVATHDEAFALVADDNTVTEPSQRLAVVAIGANGVTAPQVIDQVNDPVDLAVSPFDNAALYVSGYGNAIFSLSYDKTNAAAPFAVVGELTYVGASPQLPLVAAPITRGSLNGLVLVSENSGVRSVRFEQDGGVTDLGLFDLGPALEDATGALGVAP